jgi:hypothetical protein
MRHFAVAVLAVSIASAAIAEMTPGFVVTFGAPFPIVADFNGDGLDDLIQERNAVINSGGALATVHDFGIPADERVVGVLDVNGDHRLDLVTVGVPVVVPPSIQQEPAPMQSPGYRLYIADASRNYAAGIGISSGPQPYAADVDSDGKDDFVILAVVSNAQHLPIGTDVIVLRSRGDGTFESLAPFRIGASVQIYPDHRIQSGDLNHDGAADLVLRTTQELISLLGTGDGHFSVKSRYLPMNQEFGVQTMRLGDIDGDSNLDVVVPGFRSVRALFGDGRGNFTRTARGRFEKVHDATGYPAGLSLTPDNANQPKNFVLGHFTRGDQLQIAAGTGEGDIVILEYGTGALREVSRTATEFWLVSLRAGAFHAGGGTDLYAVGTLIWGENWPKPRLFYGVHDATAAGTVARVAGRRRSAGMSPGTALRMQMSADCVEQQAAERWSFTREGIFGVAQRGGTTIEAVFDDGQIYYRMNAPFAGETVFGVLDEANGSYSGTANVLTTCGWKVMTVNAKFE